MRLFLNSGHVSEESLELHVLGDLLESEAPDVDRHLQGCPRCRMKLAEISEFVRRFRLFAKQLRLSDSSLSAHTTCPR
jgi:anti-sigma factor RsiW